MSQCRWPRSCNRRRHTSAVLVVAVISLAIVGPAPSAAAPSSDATAARRLAEVEVVKCQVCEMAMDEAASLLEGTSSSLQEDLLTDAVEALCSVKSKYGRWLTSLDLEQVDDRLSVLRQEGYGECRRECLTVQRACAKSLKGQEEELVKLLLLQKGAIELKTRLCGAICASPLKPLPHERRDEVFEPIRSKKSKATIKDEGDVILQDSDSMISKEDLAELTKLLTSQLKSEDNEDVEDPEKLSVHSTSGSHSEELEKSSGHSKGETSSERSSVEGVARGPMVVSTFSRAEPNVTNKNGTRNATVLGTYFAGEELPQAKVLETEEPDQAEVQWNETMLLYHKLFVDKSLKSTVGASSAKEESPKNAQVTAQASKSGKASGNQAWHVEKKVHVSAAKPSAKDVRVFGGQSSIDEKGAVSGQPDTKLERKVQSSSTKQETTKDARGFAKPSGIDEKRTASGQHNTKVERNVEIEHLKCQMCRLAVDEANAHVNREQLQNDEDAVTDLVDALCTAKTRFGRWITKLDIEQDGETIVVVRHDSYGECRSECFTVQKACSKSLKGQETKLVQFLRFGAEVQRIQAGVCQKACNKSVKPLLQKRADEIFQARGAWESKILDVLDELRLPASTSTPAQAEASDSLQIEKNHTAAAGPFGETSQPVNHTSDAAKEELEQLVLSTTRTLSFIVSTFCSLLTWCGALALIIFFSVIAVTYCCALLKDHKIGDAMGRLHHWTHSAENRGVRSGIRERCRASLDQSAMPQVYRSEAQGEETLQIAEDLMVVLASQEQRIRNMERLLHRDAGAASEEARRARDLAEALRDDLERRSCGVAPPKPDSSRPPSLVRDRCEYCSSPHAEFACGGCNTSRYCSTSCQKSDWRTHRKMCGLRVRARHEATI